MVKRKNIKVKKPWKVLIQPGLVLENLEKYFVVGRATKPHPKIYPILSIDRLGLGRIVGEFELTDLVFEPKEWNEYLLKESVEKRKLRRTDQYTLDYLCKVFESENPLIQKARRSLMRMGVRNFYIEHEVLKGIER